MQAPKKLSFNYNYNAKYKRPFFWKDDGKHLFIPQPNYPKRKTKNNEIKKEKKIKNHEEGGNIGKKSRTIKLKENKQKPN